MLLFLSLGLLVRWAGWLRALFGLALVRCRPLFPPRCPSVPCPCRWAPLSLSDCLGRLVWSVVLACGGWPGSWACPAARFWLLSAVGCSACGCLCPLARLRWPRRWRFVRLSWPLLLVARFHSGRVRVAARFARGWPVSDLVVSSPSGVPAPWSRSLAFSAFGSGSLRSLVLRRSRRSFSGWVVVASFASPPRAGVFAARWAGRLGLSVVARRVGSFLAVSVPCAPPAGGGGAAGCVLARVACVGGLRRLVRLLSFSSAWGVAGV